MHDTPKKGVLSAGRLQSWMRECMRRSSLRGSFCGRTTASEIYISHGLKSITKRNKTATMKLHRPIPVFLEYYTATVNDALDVTFHPDIYDYDYAALVGPVVGVPLFLGAFEPKESDLMGSSL